MGNEKVPVLEVGDWIMVGPWAFRLQEFIERPDGDVHVRFSNANEVNKVEGEKE